MEKVAKPMSIFKLLFFAFLIVLIFSQTVAIIYLAAQLDMLSIDFSNTSNLSNKYKIDEVAYKQLLNNDILISTDNGISMAYKGTIMSDKSSPLFISVYSDDKLKSDFSNYLSRRKWDKINTTPDTGNFLNELFDFKILPNQKEVIYTLRLPYSLISDSLTTVSLYEVLVTYLYNLETKENKQILFYNTQNEKVYPRINQLSNDSKYATFDLHGCWNCGGGVANTVLVNLLDGTTKKIEPVLNFEWLDNGNYRYKQYIVNENCNNGPGICIEDPDNLPFINGTF